jgi:Resolvase, N terminal domain
VRHFLEVLDELNHLGVELISLRENIDTGGPLGRAMVVIVGAIAELGCYRARPPRRSESDGSGEEAPGLQSHRLPLSQ